MDLTKFSDPAFDSKQWVNAVLRSSKDTQTPVDAHASTLVMKLQLFIQEVSNSLDDASIQVVQSLPRVLRDVEAVRQEALLLREQMLVVKEDIKRVETETSQSMQHLLELDTVKTRMMDSQNALQEADNWTTLSADVEEVFASGDPEQISEKLIRMQQSLKVLHDVPDYEERKRLLETLKNRLEALLSPRLTAAFNSHQTADAQSYVEIFTGIERQRRVRDYYVQCNKNTLQQLWSALHSSEQHVLKYLSQFYDELLSKWQAEYSWCQQVFPEPLSMLCKLFSESLETLNPPLNQCLHSSVHRSQSPIDTLIDLRKCVLRFVKQLGSSLVDTSDSDLVYSLVEVVHIPYCQQLVQFGSLEQQLLMRKLNESKMSDERPEDTLQLALGSVSKVFSLISTALEHCHQLTEGWGINALIKTIETFFSCYLKKLSTVLQELQAQSSSYSSTAKRESEDIWTEFQWAFDFIQCCGDFLQRISSLNHQLCSFISSQAEVFKHPAGPSNPFGTFDYLRLYHPEEHTAVMELLEVVEKGGGDCQLLPQTAKQIYSLTEKAHSFAYSILSSPLQRILGSVSHLKVWSTGSTSPLESPRALTDDLPSFSRSPLAYITEIGDYLLTLPQQLEPFISQDNAAVMTALKLGQLPHAGSGSQTVVDTHPADAWLGAVAQGTMDTYINSILQIPSLGEEASQQLAADIGYLCNVLAALDQNPSPTLSALEMLLNADQTQFKLLKNHSNVPKDLYQTIAALRHWDT